MKIRSGLAIAFLLLVSFSLAGLAPDYDAGTSGIEFPISAKKLLLSKLDAKKIRDVDQLVFRRLADFDYLGVEGGFEVSWWWESAYRHGYVLRKKASDPDWSKAELFDVKLPVCVVLASPAAEIHTALSPWKRPDLTNR
jgi:hypothetical protein